MLASWTCEDRINFFESVRTLIIKANHSTRWCASPRSIYCILDIREEFHAILCNTSKRATCNATDHERQWGSSSTKLSPAFSEKSSGIKVLLDRKGDNLPTKSLYPRTYVKTKQTSASWYHNSIRSANELHRLLIFCDTTASMNHMFQHIPQHYSTPPYCATTVIPGAFPKTVHLAKYRAKNSLTLPSWLSASAVPSRSFFPGDTCCCSLRVVNKRLYRLR